MTKKVLFIGLTTVDIQYFVDKDPESNTKIKTNAPFIVAGGPAANAAVAYSFLGGEAHFLTCVGQNSFRALIYDDLNKHRVKLFDYGEDKPFHPIVASVVTNTSNSERTIFTHHPDKLPKIESYESVDIKEYDCLFIDGFYPELAIPICKKAKQLGIEVIFDGGSWKPHLPILLPYVDVAICSANFQPPNCTSKQEVINHLKNYRIRDIAISRGEKSIVLETQKIEIEDVDAVDSLGAGDILHGAFCWYWLHDRNFSNALLKATKIATHSTQSKGTRCWMESYK